MSRITIRSAEAGDAALIHRFITALAEYERLSDAVVATPEMIGDALFGPRPFAEVILAELDGRPAGFALFFHKRSIQNRQTLSSINAEYFTRIRI